MDNIEEYILKINVQTTELKVENVQKLLKEIKQEKFTQVCTEELGKHCCTILAALWRHMDIGLAELDDQLLCSTCFYTILIYSNDKDYYLKQIMDHLNHELYLKEKMMESKNMCFTISLAYGIFQSSIILHILDDSSIAAILKIIFNLLILKAYEYSRYTFIIFKIITFFKKVASTCYHEIIFNKVNNFKLLNVINHNWENPITGVRNLNKIIFQNLIMVMDEEMLESIQQNLKNFYWNKAKYLMIGEIIEQYQGRIKVLITEFNMIEGLIYSLNKNGLVSAGTDMYIAIVKKLNTDDEWCSIFLDKFVDIATRSSRKPIENFFNYWCLNTLKKFPSLTKTIFDEIKTLKTTDLTLYSCLSTIQQSNRLGLLEKYLTRQNIEECISHGIEHNDVHIKILSFDIVCGSHGKLPDQKEYIVILDFLINNVNLDCPVLRINMIKSLQNFLVQLHIKFVNNWNNKDFEVENLVIFCKNVQIFINDSLNINGNYQRKIATILVAKTMLNSLKEIPRKKLKGTKQLHMSLLDYLMKRNQWILYEECFVLKLISLLKDPSDDIREQVMDILLNNYSGQLCKSDLMSYLTEEAKGCLRSRFFYQITCGQTILKLVVNLLMMEYCTEGQFKTVEDVFMFAYEIIISEYNLNMDIVKSINVGKQLHSYLSILHSIFEVCLEKSYQLTIPIYKINTLIDILKTISNQFAWEQEASVSSDFSKMNDMVEALIANSENQIHHQDNELNISGLHQIVLNCLWLNVKASCELSSILIKYYKDDTHKDICEQCLKIICNVLETSRHKGAIEAGGATLGQAIQQLTLSPAGSMISKIPMLLLKSKFHQLISETSTMASVTRRGAGLSIMIHRIVSNDMKKGKPLLNYFMQAILDTCNRLNKSCSNDNVATSNERDLPKAINIHFLTKIVTDSSLASDMMYYSARLAELAFDNLSSSCWQIRNAALQLYGSLIPKLIGQKKNSGAGEEVIATVAVDEFRTHSPKLWEYIETQLKVTNISNCDIIQSHNNLVPTLSILANLAPLYSFSNEMVYDKDLLSSLKSLLGSPIYIVRRLTSMCLLNIYNMESIYNVLLDSALETENSLHGTLMLLNEFVQQCNSMCLKEKPLTLKSKYCNILTKRKCSYLCKEKFEATFPECIELTDNMLKETLSELNQNSTALGIFLWANFRIQCCIESISWANLPSIIKAIADCSDFETYCETLCKRIECEKGIPENISLELCNTLYLLGFKRKSITIIWRTLYVISLCTESLSNQIETSTLHKYLLDNGISFSMRYMVAFAARIFKDNADEELSNLSNIIFYLSNPQNADVDMRLIGATANNELASRFTKLSDCAKLNTLKASVMFLQDEDEDIRNLSIHFYRQVSGNVATHPYICLKKILNGTFLQSVLVNPTAGIQSICDDLMDLLKSLYINNEGEYNPFANSCKNIYLEPEVLKQLLVDLKLYK